ncbi:MAG: bacteriohemerythrin [Patescibacteria group bacterium]
MPIIWKPELSVHVQLIDEQHQFFVDLMNETYDAFYKLELHDRLPHLVDQIAAYGLMHFQTEEHFFDEFNYEFANEHKEEHRKLLAQVVSFKERLAKEGDNKIVIELISFLEGWLVNHLAIHDAKYVECFTSHGLK